MPITLTQICAQFQEERQRLASLWEANHDPQAYLRAHTAVLDQAIRSMIALHDLPTKDIAIIAVGGYGRAELFPFSDIDLFGSHDRRMFRKYRDSRKDQRFCDRALGASSHRWRFSS